MNKKTNDQSLWMALGFVLVWLGMSLSPAHGFSGSPRPQQPTISESILAGIDESDEEQDEEKTDKPTEEKDADDEVDSEANQEESSAEDSPLAIVGGDIQTVTRGVIRRGTILIQGGKILAVGQQVEIPEDAEVIDAKGMVITPGFVSLGMSRIGLGSSANSTQNKVADALDPYDQYMKFCLGVGITSGAVQISGSSSRFRFSFEAVPGSGAEQEILTIDELIGLHDEGGISDEEFEHLMAHVSDEGDGHEHSHPSGLFEGPATPGMTSLFDERFFGEEFLNGLCGHCADTRIRILPEPLAPPSPTRQTPNRFAVIKLNYGDLDGMLVSESPFYSLSASALTGPFNRYSWRANIEKGREYLEDLKAYEKAKADGDKSAKEPRNPVDDNLIKMIKKEVPLRISAFSVDQIRDMLDLAEELDYELVIDGATEAWVIAEELGVAKTPVVVTPRARRSAQPGRETSTGSSIEITGILEQAGVPFAVAPLSSSVSLNGLAGRDLTSLPLEAAFAVRGGAGESTVLEALTIVPARILGLEDRIGSIEEGKDADLLILDGPPLDYRTYVDQAIVNGKVRYDRERDHVYPVFERGDY